MTSDLFIKFILIININLISTRFDNCVYTYLYVNDSLFCGGGGGGGGVEIKITFGHELFL